MIDGGSARPSLSLLLSIHPKYADAIIAGTKTIEIRRTRPRMLASGGVIYLYASSPVQAVLGLCVLEDIVTGNAADLWRIAGRRACLDRAAYDNYLAGSRKAHALVIEQPLALTNPVSLPAIEHAWPGFKPPQSFRYIDASVLWKLGLPPQTVHMAPCLCTPNRGPCCAPPDRMGCSSTAITLAG